MSAVCAPGDDNSRPAKLNQFNSNFDAAAEGESVHRRGRVSANVLAHDRFGRTGLGRGCPRRTMVATTLLCFAGLILFARIP